MEHHADFAVPVTQQLWLRTSVPRRGGEGTVQGWAIALGWWVEPNMLTPEGAPGEPAGTLYLIVDDAQPGPPVWVREAHIVSSQVLGLSMPPTMTT